MALLPAVPIARQKQVERTAAATLFERSRSSYWHTTMR